jgi:hypothetical protein
MLGIHTGGLKDETVHSFRNQVAQKADSRGVPDPYFEGLKKIPFSSE